MTRSVVTDVLLVAVGGAAGSLLRWGLGHVLPSGSVWHWSTLTVNVVGALLLGLLLEALTRPGVESRRTHTARLLLGTGLLGGFTTYSTFAQELWEQVRYGDTTQALAYAAVTLVAGLLATAGGMVLGTRLGTRPSSHARGVAEGPEQ